jgi:hypothetical protein
MTILRTLLLTGVLLPFAALSLSSCATISEDECVAASWQDIGYNDGRSGTSRGRFADISKTCAKYSVVPDREAYMRGFEQGIPLFCTYDNGYSNGESGSGVNTECRNLGSQAYADGHADGYVVYQIRSEHRELINRYEETTEDVIEVRRRLREETLDRDEERRLEKKLYRLETRADDLRIEIRALERLHGLPRYDG